jgi:rhamnose utilization protein RhaD (predicted bifunctional aldolase and dehydrogenase)
MPHKFVVHLHPVEAMAHLARPNRENDLHTALGDAFAWDLVSYHKPGADLAQAIHSKLLKNPDIQVVLLENHGVIVGAETLIEVDRLLQILNQKLSVRQRSMNGAPAGAPRIAAGELDGNAYRVCPDATMHLLACDPELYERLDDSWAICPDHVVFLGAKAVRIDDLADLGCSREAIDSAPPFIFVKDAGVLESIAATPAQKAQLVFYLDVMIRQPTGHRLATLSYDEVASLLNWDAEKYRQSVNL